MAEEQNPIVAAGEGTLPVLPLRDVVVFPHMVIPLFVGRKKSIAALEEAMSADKQILLVAQKDAAKDEPGEEDIHKVGTLSTILQLLKLPDGTVKVLVEGGYRARIEGLISGTEYISAHIDLISESGSHEDREMDAMMRTVFSQFEQYVKLSKKTPPEVLSSVASIKDPARLADTIAPHLSLKVEEKQEILEMEDLRERLEHLYSLMEAEIESLQMEKRISGRVKSQMEKSQREYFLNEQLKAIQKELGEEEGGNEADELAEKIENAGMPKAAKEKAEKELKKFRMMSPMSAEATVVRNYIDWLISFPWKKKSRVTRDLKKAERTLEADHYGLENVKERILEYLAVQYRTRKLKGPILCFVGPPGVGKTSLGQSIARATNRKFVRMSLGGVRDEAEIRGHRRTYIGALPGRIVQNLVKAGTRNPLMLFDEVDKMGMDFRGDPSSAMLEVLDPEQNYRFQDHYMETEIDLSDVMFITTANTLNIPPALRDRMEIIQLPGYTEEEKLHIAERYLLPKQKKTNGLKENELHVSRQAVLEIIRRYTREAGVRNLERELSSLCRKAAKELVVQPNRRRKVQVTQRNLEKYLGVPRYRFGLAEEENQVGAATGLAWTEVGGELLNIEASILSGKGKLTITGQLGDVMQESIQAAMSVVRARARWLGLDPGFYQKHDVHVHVPEGATPKDGPSAGIAMCTAIISSFTGIPVRADIGMTGELTLRGRVLPIGGLKEKLLAARRGGLKEVILPKENNKELTEIPDHIKNPLTIHLVETIDEVLELSLEHLPEPLPETSATIQTDREESQQEHPAAH